MTLIACFKCSDGVVLCADSQETVGEYRFSRQKLVPFLAGNFELAIAGSGNDGDLIDSFVQRLQNNLTDFQGTTLGDLRKFIASE